MFPNDLPDIINRYIKSEGEKVFSLQGSALIEAPIERHVSSLVERYYTGQTGESGAEDSPTEDALIRSYEWMRERDLQGYYMLWVQFNRKPDETAQFLKLLDMFNPDCFRGSGDGWLTDGKGRPARLEEATQLLTKETYDKYADSQMNRITERDRLAREMTARLYPNMEGRGMTQREQAQAQLARLRATAAADQGGGSRRRASKKRKYRKRRTKRRTKRTKRTKRRTKRRTRKRRTRRTRRSY
jgi:hypothetical protein